MGLKDQVATIKGRDPAIKSSIEVILYPSFWAMISHSIAHWLYKHRWFFIARALSQFSRFITGIEIHPGATIGKGLFIDHGSGVVIGETCEIGDNVTIYQGVTLGGTGKEIGKRHPTIGNNVMIGSGVKILGPFKIGNNARIGAGSVVLHEIPPDSTAVGIPARVVRRKHEEQIKIDQIDQIRFPDPVQMELCALTNRIEELEKRLSERIGKNTEGKDSSI
ncbi:MAG: serine O-acetyltransferase [Clostridiales bacterium]|jgi:serine O-acetyltransferase|nr:serine O-acetyltransferase [Clostridiales bacterium]